MAIFHTDTASFNSLLVTGSGGNLFSVTNTTSSNINLLSVSTGSIDIFTVDSLRNVVISGSLKISGSITSTSGITDITLLNTYTGSNNATLLRLYQTTASLNTITGSMQAVVNRVLQATASLNTTTGSLIGITNGLMALTASMKAATIFSSSAQVIGSVVSAGSRYTIQELVLGSGTTLGYIASDGGKPIYMRPNGVTSNNVAVFWPTGGSLSVGNTAFNTLYTNYGYTFDVSGSVRVSGNQQITGSLLVITGGITGSVLSTNGVISSSNQIQSYNLFAVTSSANTFYGNQTITGSLNVTGSINIDNVIKLTPVTSFPNGQAGMLVASASYGKTNLYVYDGSNWKWLVTGSIA